MAIGLEEKKAIVAEVQEAAKTALSAVVADSRGVEVADMTALRKQARDAGVWLKVVRNTLARRAVEGTDYECLSDAFVGPTIIAFSNEHPGAGARILKEFAKGNDKLELKAAAFEGASFCTVSCPAKNMMRASVTFRTPVFPVPAGPMIARQK